MQRHAHATFSADLRSALGVRDIVALLHDRHDPHRPSSAMTNERVPGNPPSGEPLGRDDAHDDGEERAHIVHGPVLVVDDDGDIRESLMEAFEEHGYRVLGARDGEDAFAKIRQSPVPPCLIVLDLMMPNMDGWTFREEQRRRPNLAAIPVVVMSANRDVATLRFSRELEPVACLAKPLDVGTLLRIAKEHCAPHTPTPAEDSAADD